MKDEKSLERNKNEQLNIEIEELEAKCGLYKHNTEKLNKSFEMEVRTNTFFRIVSCVVLKCATLGVQYVPKKYSTSLYTRRLMVIKTVSLFAQLSSALERIIERIFSERPIIE